MSKANMTGTLVPLPRDIIAQAVDALEHEQNTDKALELDEKAYHIAFETKDFATAAEALSHAALVTGRQYRNTNDPMYLEKGLDYAKRAVVTAKESSEPGAAMMPLYNLAKSLERSGTYADAVTAFDEAIQMFTATQPAIHNSQAILHDIQIHREYTAYKNGDKSAINRLEKAITNLAATQHGDTYELDVWVSGGHLKAAEILASDDHVRGLRHLMEARKIIHVNPELVLRAADWWEVAQNYAKDLDLLALFEEAQMERDNGAIPQCLIDYEEVRKKALESGKVELAGDCLHGMGLAYYHKEEYDLADETYKKAEEEFLKANNLMRAASVQRDRGILASKLKKYIEAESFFNDSITTLSRVGDLGHLGMTQVKLGLMFADKGDIMSGEAKAREGLSNVEKSNAWYFLSNAHRDIGRILIKAKRREEAKKELEIARQVLDDHAHEHIPEDNFSIDRKRIAILLQEAEEK